MTINYDTQNTHSLTLTLMSRDLLIGLMRKGNTGNELLAILDAIVNNEEPMINKSQPTLEELTF